MIDPIRTGDAVISISTLVVSLYYLYQGRTDVAIYWMLVCISAMIPARLK